jgi:hypothetical protein
MPSDAGLVPKLRLGTHCAEVPPPELHGAGLARGGIRLGASPLVFAIGTG